MIEGLHKQVIDYVCTDGEDLPIMIFNKRNRNLTLQRGTLMYRMSRFEEHDGSNTNTKTESAVQTSETISSVLEFPENNWRPSEHVIMDTENLTPEQLAEFKKLIDEFAEIFSKGDEDLGISKYTHKITLSDDTPTKSRPYRVPYKQLKIVEEHLDQMLRMGVIRKSNSPWASPVVMVEKSDGTLRFCVDFRKVNEKTIKDSYPMPLIEDKLNA